MIPDNPNRQGSNRKSPVENWNCCHFFSSHYCLCFVTQFFDMSPSDPVRVSAGRASRGRGYVWAAFAEKNHRQEKKGILHSIAPSLVLLSSPPPHQMESSSQTDIQKSFLSFFIPYVFNLIYSRILLDAGWELLIIFLQHAEPSSRALMETMREG